MEISGFDADSIVTQLMQLERIPLTALQSRKDAAKSASDAITKIRSSLDAFRLAAAKLADVSTFDRFKTAVSHSDIAAASVSGTASSGSLTFTVDRLAQAHGLRSIGTVATDTTAVTTAAFVSVAAGTRSVGIDTVSAGRGLDAGTSVLEITQASAGATTTGSPVASSTVIGPGNDTIDITVNGSARTVTIAAGTYSADQLTTAVQSAFDASGGGVTATLDTAGALQLTTTREGSAATLQSTGGTALGGDPFGSRLIEIENGDFRSLPGEAAAGRPADSTSAPRHDDGPAFESLHGVLLWLPHRCGELNLLLRQYIDI